MRMVIESVDMSRKKNTLKDQSNFYFDQQDFTVLLKLIRNKSSQKINVHHVNNQRLINLKYQVNERQKI